MREPRRRPLSSTRPRRALPALVLVSAGAATACGSSSPPLLGSGPVIATPPSRDALLAFSRLTNAIPTEIEVDGSVAYGVVDTGNPWALLDPAAFPAVATLSANGGTLDAITSGGLTVPRPFAFSTSTGDVSGDATLTLRGNLGCSVLCGQVAAFDYRGVTFALGDAVAAAAPTDVGPALSVPFILSGGGTDDGVVVPASRVVVAVTIEGTVLSMILDTGASDIILSASAFAALTADGRVQTDGGMNQTTTGSSESSITRAATVLVGGAEVDRPIVSHDTAFDANLAEVSADVGHTIDGSLGGTFLRNFYLTVDYPGQTVALAPYPDVDFLLDQGERLGITVTGVDGAYAVDQVTAAASALGVTVGDAVTAIDGQDLATLSPLEVAVLFYGKVGSTKLVTFATATALEGQTIPLTVEELLPLPAPR